jgi:hypothetical protein
LVSETGLRNSQVLHQLISDLIETIRKTPKSVSLCLLKRHEDVSNLIPGLMPLPSGLTRSLEIMYYYDILFYINLFSMFDSGMNRLVKRTTP